MTDIASFQARFSSEEQCLNHLFEHRYPAGLACPDCGQPTKWYRVRSYAKFGTNCCSKPQVSPKSGTLFAGSKLPLRTWFYTMLLFSNARSGLTMLFLTQHLGLSMKAAFRTAACTWLQSIAAECLADLAFPSGLPAHYCAVCEHRGVLVLAG